MKNLILLIGLMFLILHALPLEAQSYSDENTQGFDMTDFPQWTRDLRRGEIVAFGSFPFTLLLSRIVMDTYRSATNGWDRRYAPWPLTAAGAVGMTQEQHFMTLGFAVGGSIIVALVDHLIVRNRRNRQEQESLSIAPGTPIIIRRSIDEELTEEEHLRDRPSGGGLDLESENP